MIKTLHGLSTMHCNVVTEIRIARETGYDAVEILVSKLVRYLDSGFDAKDLLKALKKYSISVACFNALQSIERFEPKEHGQLLEEAERLCAAAKVLSCPTIQLVPLCRLMGRPYSEILKITARNVSEIADIGKKYGVRFQLEPIAFSPINSLSRSLELIEEAGRDNVGMVIDFWHLWSGGKTSPEEVAKLKKEMIYGIHFCDGVRPEEGEIWDEFKLRGFLPGEGKIPIKEWVSAVKSTGFNGVWSSELVSPKHWEYDLWEMAKVCKVKMDQYL